MGMYNRIKKRQEYVKELQELIGDITDAESREKVVLEIDSFILFLESQKEIISHWYS